VPDQSKSGEMGINVKGVKMWMINNDVFQRDIIQSTGRKQAIVNHTINGRRSCRDVIRYLEQCGCPRKLLGMPEKKEQ
jgi:hypothetical protein